MLIFFNVNLNYKLINEKVFLYIVVAYNIFSVISILKSKEVVSSYLRQC
jgi:hypothetical protein